MPRSWKSNAALTYLRRSGVPYGKRALAARVAIPNGDCEIVHRTRDGLTFHLDLRDYVMRQLYLFDTYEANTQRHLYGLLREDMTFFDVGANVGAYTLPAALRLPLGRVFSFEPHPRSADYLRRNVCSSGLTNVEVIPDGLSDRSGQALLHSARPDAEGRVNRGASSLNGDEDESPIDVNLTTVDQFCSDHRIDHVDVMKIDVEGHEMEVLRGAEATITTADRMILIVEVNGNAERSGGSRHEILSFTEDLGFTCHLPRAWPRPLEPISAVGDDYGDNLIFLKEAP